ncbi:MAG: hypothetical protein R3293_23155 [Candidatus Promineifilaceae bacterium]|nr:hypothetical protein [Candidatus Promineifilaceae bacterium]
MKKTAAVYILAIIAVIAGIVAIFDTIRYLQFAFSPLSFLGAPWLGAILSGLVALIWFWAAARIWNLDPRGWIFMVSLAVIYLVFDVIALIAGTPIDLLMGSIVINALALILGLLPSTKEAFGTG